MTQLEATQGFVAVACIFQLIHLVRIAESRWLAIGRAVGGFVLAFLISLVFVFFAPPRLYDAIGSTLTFAAPIAACMGAFSVPTRSKK